LVAYQSLKQLSYLCFSGVHSFAKLEAMQDCVATQETVVEFRRFGIGGICSAKRFSGSKGSSDREIVKRDDDFIIDSYFLTFS
jgi:hypothetical protein